ncbi:MAG: hypothetical protein AMS27_09120 [Bacteroides sp. SM23_62_1]|nr:MAG: hypothetical protein AMS27_09120 [Bacteroides sp. SM23_62_1]
MLAGNILIWGEFPPNTHTGVSISNQTVLHFLQSENISPIIIEEYSWNKKNIGKVFHFLRLYLKVIRIICKKKIKIFYFTLPLSVSGGFKFLAILPVIKLLSSKTVLKAHIHRGDFKDFVNKNTLNRIIVRCSFRFIDEIVVLSQAFLQDVLNFSTKLKVTVLHNTSLVESFTQRPFKEHRKEFICISNYIKSKGIYELIECFRFVELQDIRLSVYGHFYDKLFYNKLKLSAPVNVSLNGPLGRDDFWKVLNQSDCLIMPSWNEGQPIIIIEAMSLGIPVIATEIGDIPDMFGEKYKFLAKPGDIDSLFQCILEFDRFEEKKIISEYLHQRYQNKYSNKSYKKRLLEIFGQL